MNVNLCFEDLSTTFKVSMNVSFDTSLLILLLISDITIMHIANKFACKYLSFIQRLLLLDDVKNL